MRALTKLEKQLCRSLINADRIHNHQFLIGEEVRKICGAYSFQQDMLGGGHEEYPYKVIITLEEEKRDETIEKFYEIVAFLLILEKKGMISLLPAANDNPIGKINHLLQLIGKEAKLTQLSILDMLNVNSWEMLNSYCYLTNGFKDFVRHHFRTIEARRHCCSQIVAWSAILISIALAICSRL